MKTKHAIICSISIFATLTLALAACAPMSNEASTPNDPASYPEGCLMAVHTEGQLDNVEDFSKKFCLSCHDRKAIVAANENWGGDEGVNPHAAHTESYDCTKCHSIDGTSVLVCNDACHHHEWKVPDGWQIPSEELPSADGTAV